MESGPERSPRYEELSAAEILADYLEAARAANALETAASRGASQEIAGDRNLLELLDTIIENGPELDPDRVAHMRRVVALRLSRFTDAQKAATEDAAFYGFAAAQVQSELDELAAMPGLEDLPDVWDIAYGRLLDLEAGETGA